MGEEKEFNLLKIADERDTIWLKYIDKIQEEHRLEVLRLNNEWIRRMASIENVYRRHLGLPELKED